MRKQRASHPQHLTMAALYTGGTVDKIWDLDTEALVVGPPIAPKYLRQRLPHMVRIHHRGLMRIDSLYMTDEHREQIVQECTLVRAEHIIITHGTGTVLETAEALHKGGIGNDHTVMLVGAFRPAAFRVTDAYHNLELAINALFKRPPGIYIAVGHVFRWDQCVKDPARHKFVRR